MLPQQSVIWETDPAKMTAEWATQVLRYRRMYWQQVISPTLYADMKAMVLSMQSMEEVKASFDDEEFLRYTKFSPLPFFEKPRNILIDELKKSGIKPYVEANDPTSLSKKDADKFLLQNRHVLETTLNQGRSKIGLPPYKVDKTKFNGNIDDFDKMGLSDQSAADIDFFFKTFYKLSYEAYAQVLVDSYMELNKVDDEITRFLIDILACKCVCKQDYISPLTGEIKSVYLQPSQTYAIFGRNRDATDASVRGWEIMITVEQLLSQLGAAFDFEKHWSYLIRAINFGSGQVFDGFIRNGINYAIEGFPNADIINQTQPQAPVDRLPLNLLSWENSFNYKVYFGYAEWEQLISDVRKQNTKTGQRFPADFEFKPTDRSTYVREDRTYFKTLCTYYIPIGAFEAQLFGYGDLYHQLTEGQYDEYSRGSISVIREEGLSAAAAVEPYIKLGNYAYYRMLWAIKRSKPDVWDFSYESIRDVAMKLMPSVAATQGVNTPQIAGAFQSAVDSLVEKFKRKLVMFHTHPISAEGHVMGGGGSGHQKIPGAVDQLAIQLREVVLQWAEDQIVDKLGLGGLNETSIPNPKEGLKLNEIRLKQSRAATGYIPDMIEKTYEHSARIILLYAQDIIKHKASVPYDYLLDLVGKKVIASIEQLGNVAAHRLGIFVNSLDSTASKEEIMQQAEIALEQKLITFGQYLMLKEIKEPRLAAITFAYYEDKQQKLLQSNQMQLVQQQQATIQMQHNFKMQEIDAEGRWGYRNATAQAQATVQGKQLDYKGKLDSKVLQIQSEPVKQQNKEEAAIDLATHKNELESQKAFGT